MIKGLVVIAAVIPDAVITDTVKGLVAITAVIPDTVITDTVTVKGLVAITAVITDTVITDTVKGLVSIAASHSFRPVSVLMYDRNLSATHTGCGLHWHATRLCEIMMASTLCRAMSTSASCSRI
jgi:hypothetical protein